MLDWDDLRLILAIGRAGSFAAAATVLGVSTPTVFRRAQAAEQRLGALLFLRDTTGVSLSPAGRDAAACALRIEEEVGGLVARVGNQSHAAEGLIRLATVDTLLAGPLTPLLRLFRERHPRILLDVQSGVGMANLRQREVDAALRAGGEPPEGLVGRRLCRIAVAVYCSTAGPRVVETDLASADWVVPDEQLKHLASFEWLRRHGYDQRPALRANTLHTLALGVAAGIGVAILPCYLADGDSRLVRVGGLIDELAGDLWFLTHEELRNTARIRALSDFFGRQFRDLRPLFHGERPALPPSDRGEAS